MFVSVDKVAQNSIRRALDFGCYFYFIIIIIIICVCACVCVCVCV